MDTEAPPHTLLDRAYWRDPVQVFAGLTWFVVGLAIGGWLL